MGLGSAKLFCQRYSLVDHHFIRDVDPISEFKSAQSQQITLYRVEVIEGDYTDAPDIEATWFVDPPYQATRERPEGVKGAGDCYARGCGGSDLDFAALGAWCRARRGQVIACDYASSNWLPFEPLARNTDSVGRAYTEGVWSNVPKAQLDMFA